MYIKADTNIPELGTEYFLLLWKNTDWFMAVIASLEFILSLLFANLV